MRRPLILPASKHLFALIALAFHCIHGHVRADDTASPVSAPSAAERLEDISAALAEIPGTSHVMVFELGDAQLRTGGHLQGIQLRYDPAERRQIAFLTHDSLTVASLLVVAFPATGPLDFSGHGKLLHLLEFPSDGVLPPLRHAGGIQLQGDVLVVGIEDNQQKLRSQVQFWDVANPSKPRQLSHLTIHRTSKTPKLATAGAVGLIARQQDHLLAVANWDSRTVDFYQSNGNPLHDHDCRFTLRCSWHAKSANTVAWQPDRITGTYQAINLVADRQQRLFLLGFDTMLTGGDVVDLFRVDLEKPESEILQKLARRPLELPRENHFRYAAGAIVQDGRLVILSSPRNVAGQTWLGVTVSPAKD